METNLEYWKAAANMCFDIAWQSSALVRVSMSQLITNLSYVFQNPKCPMCFKFLKRTLRLKTLFSSRFM